jgi:lipopolysaccharide transport system ATP-binding protein
VVRNEHQVIFSLEDALVFHVRDATERRGNWHGKWPGVVRPDLNWTTEYLGESKEATAQ